MKTYFLCTWIVRTWVCREIKCPRNCTLKESFHPRSHNSFSHVRNLVVSKTPDFPTEDSSTEQNYILWCSLLTWICSDDLHFKLEKNFLKKWCLIHKAAKHTTIWRSLYPKAAKYEFQWYHYREIEIEKVYKLEKSAQTYSSVCKILYYEIFLRTHTNIHLGKLRLSERENKSEPTMSLDSWPLKVCFFRSWLGSTPGRNAWGHPNSRAVLQWESLALNGWLFGLDFLTFVLAPGWPQAIIQMY